MHVNMTVSVTRSILIAAAVLCVWASCLRSAVGFGALTQTPCPKCTAQFVAKGGCEKLAANASRIELHKLVTLDCGHCAQEAANHCAACYPFKFSSIAGRSQIVPTCFNNATCAPPVKVPTGLRVPIIRKLNAECNSADQKLGDFSTLDACAAACRATNGCTFFVYGQAQGPQGNKAGGCYYEHTKSALCSEGWETDSYNFYELSAPGSVTAPGANRRRRRAQKGADVTCTCKPGFAGTHCERLTVCVPYSEQACMAAAAKAGLKLGGVGYAFAGASYMQAGCYAYATGNFRGHAYYGRSGSGGGKSSGKLVLPRYRPKGFECSAGGDSCPVTFKVDATPRNYIDSVKYCKSQGMAIASVHSQAENDMIRPLLKTVSYLGAVETKINAKWAWTDGTPWDYTNPSNDGLKSSETRLAYNPGTPQWHDWGTGSDKLGVICRNVCAGPKKILPINLLRCSGRSVTETTRSSRVWPSALLQCGSTHPAKLPLETSL